MGLEIGIVCGKCDWYSPMHTDVCESCGSTLALDQPLRSEPNAQAPETASASPAAAQRSTRGAFDVQLERRKTPSRPSLPPQGRDSPPPRKRSSKSFEAARPTSSTSGSGTHPSPLDGIDLEALGISLEELMEQAKSFVCRSCSTPVSMGHKFCGRCGAAVPAEIVAARTQFFGQLQTPGRAKLILIRGEGVEGLSYQLNAEQHIVGKKGQLVFPDDPFVSPTHANLFYRDAQLVVRDEGSLNGVYLRIRGTVEIKAGDLFLAGEQVFRLDATPKATDGPAPDGTYFYSSPKHQSPFRVTQILEGGAAGMTVCARSSGIQIGREGGDLNFPTDLYMSASHCQIEESGGALKLTDLNSRNGTYLRIAGEQELRHGDYLFIGRKLLRVEITAAA